jgi:hypothetical protein
MVALSFRGKTTISSLGVSARPCHSRKLSRITRFIRFRPLAWPSTLRETAIPSLEKRPAPGRASIRKQSSEDTVGFLKTRLKSAGFSSLCCRVNAARLGGLLDSAAEMAFFPRSGRETLSAFGAAGLDDGASGPRGHAGTETVPAGPLEAAWLECTFHFLILRNSLVRYRPFTSGRQKRGIVTFPEAPNKM